MAEITQALEARAQYGRDAVNAGAVAQLRGVRERVDRGLDEATAIDALLTEAIRNLDTPHLIGGRGNPHTQATIHCFVAVYGRLDVATELTDRSWLAAEQVLPNLTSQSKAKVEASKLKLHLLEAFDRDGPWWPPDESEQETSVKATMGAALGLPSTGQLDNYRRLAPTLLGAEVMRNEANFYLPFPHGPAIKLRDAEETLHAHGLLASYSRTKAVRMALSELKQVLARPLDGYTEPVHTFRLVLDQLQTTHHSLHGIMGTKDTQVAENEEYVRRQLETLATRAISIERVFLYDEGDEADARELAEDQAQKMGKVIRENGAGSFKAYLVPRSVALGHVHDEERFLSLVIIDSDMPTQRVVTQVFGWPHKYEVSASELDVQTAEEHFEVLRTNCAPEDVISCPDPRED
jgi:hypothetical protein